MKFMKNFHFIVVHDTRLFLLPFVPSRCHSSRVHVLHSGCIRVNYYILALATYYTYHFNTLSSMELLQIHITCFARLQKIP